MTQILVSLLPFVVLMLLWVVFVGRLQRRHANDSPVEQREPHVEGLEPSEVWSPSGAVHTYRDPDVLEHKAPLTHAVRGGLALGLLLVLLGVAIVGFAKGFTSAEVDGTVALALFFAITYFGNRQYRGRVCGEIRLGDDGTCELETKRRVIRLHVNQIESVKYENDPDRRAAYYIAYQDGSVPVSSAMTGFPEFLSRLKTLNPAVDLASFPAKAWPDLHPAAIDGRRTDLTRLIRSAVFPLIVITLLVYLASETLLGK
jgi:hypothetical protein